MVGVAHLAGGEVQALDERSGVYPFQPLVPALDGRRVDEVLAHVYHLHLAVEYLAPGAVELAGEAEDAGHQFGGTLDAGLPGVFGLEEVGGEERFEHLAYVVSAVEVGVG